MENKGKLILTENSVLKINGKRKRKTVELKFLDHWSDSYILKRNALKILEPSFEYMTGLNK